MHLSNFEDSDGKPLSVIADDFQYWTWLRNSKPLKKLTFMLYGCNESISGTLNHHLISKIRKKFLNASGARCSSLFVQLIRKASDDPKFGHLIGRNCMSVITEPTGNFLTQYDPEKTESISYFPHLVTEFGSFKEMWVYPGILLLKIRFEAPR